MEWKVNTSRLISLLSSRMYSDVVTSGIKELVVNSLDAKANGTVNIDIEIMDGTIRYSDDGMGINPLQFDSLFGTIASSHERTINARGMFGIGRLGLLSISDNGRIISYYNGTGTEWMFNMDGYQLVRDGIKGKEHGVYLEYNGVAVKCDINRIRDYLSTVLAIPLLNECTIKLNGTIVPSKITNDYSYSKYNTSYGSIEVWYKADSAGILYYNHKGVGVYNEPLTGLSLFINESYLDIKTDREGYILNDKYRDFKRYIKTVIADVRPLASYEYMQVQFVKSVMSEFRKYWMSNKALHNEIELQYHDVPIITDLANVQSNATVDNESIIVPIANNNSNSLSKEHRELSDNIQFTDSLNNVHREEEPSNISTVKVSRKDKPLVVRGAKLLSLGTNMPMIFYEKEPFIFLFNTSHPSFNLLIEKSTVSRAVLAVLFERMLECIYESRTSTEDISSLRNRWTSVDNDLYILFSKL